MTDDPINIDRIYRKRSAYNDHNKETIDQERDDDVPEGLMTKLEDFIGDREASITVGGSLSSNRDFHKAEAFVSIRVACNNDLDDIDAVHDIVQPYIAKLAQHDLEEMSMLRDPWLEPHRRLHQHEVSAKAPPKKTPTSLPPEEGAKKQPPKRVIAKAKNPGVKRPSYRR